MPLDIPVKQMTANLLVLFGRPETTQSVGNSLDFGTLFSRPTSSNQLPGPANKSQISSDDAIAVSFSEQQGHSDPQITRSCRQTDGTVQTPIRLKLCNRAGQDKAARCDSAAAFCSVFSVYRTTSMAWSGQTNPITRSEHVPRRSVWTPDERGLPHHQ